MIANPRLWNYHSVRYKSKNKRAAHANEYVKEEKNTMFSAKFHAVLLQYNRDYLLSNTLI